MSKTTETIISVVIVIGGFISIQWLFLTCNTKDQPDYYKYNPRHATQGIDTSYTEDSMYIFRLKIDTVLVLEKDEEPKEDPRR